MISICIATYNGEEFIEQQLNSILPQLSDNDEIIISDDCSSDNTINIIKQISDPRIKIFRHLKVPCGTTSAYVTKNFENALLNVRGEYVFLSDQDDIWFHNKIKIMLDYLQNYDMVISDAYITDKQLNLLHTTRFFPGCGQTKNLLKAYISTHPFQGSCMAFKRRVLDMALPFPRKVSSHDTWLGYIATTFFKVRLIPEQLMYYRRHENVVSITGKRSHKALVKKVGNRLRYLTLVLLRGIGII